MDLINLVFMLNTYSKDNKYIIISYILIYIFTTIITYRNFKIKNFYNYIINLTFYKTVFNFKIKLQYSSEYARYYPIYSDESEALLWKYINTKSIQNNIKFSQEIPVSMEIIKRYKCDTYFNHYKIGIQNTGILIHDDIYIFFEIDTETTNNRNKNDSENNYGEIILINMILKSKNNNSKYIQDFVTKIYIEYNNWKDELSYKTKQIYFTGLNNKGSSIFYKYDFNSNKTFDNMFFEEKNNIISRINEYTNNIKQYKKLGIPHTLGFLFHGEPGCGKTSCIKAIANYLDRNIISINLAHIFDINDLRRIFLDKRFLSMNEEYGGYEYTIDNIKRIYVFEEIDCNNDDNILLDRNIKPSTNDNSNNTNLSNILNELTDKIDTNKNIRDFSVDSKKSRKKTINLGEILELLDGISETEDRIIIFTTNYPSKLDKALIRPGRIDMTIEFKKLRKVDIRDNFKLWFNIDIPKDKYNLIKNYSITQADFGKLCFENKDNPLKIIDIIINNYS
jgi:hypothetical protein